MNHFFQSILEHIGTLPSFLQFLLVLPSSLLSEDLTLFSTAALSFSGAKTLPLWIFFFGNFTAILLGDCLLYGIGRLIAAHRKSLFGFPLTSFQKKAVRYKKQGFLGLIMTRFLPGTRLPALLAAGISRYPFPLFIFAKFISITLLLTLTGTLFYFWGEAFAELFKKRFPFAILLILLLIITYFKFKKIAPYLLRPLYQKAFFLQFFRRFSRFEFWPSWLFYLPIAPYYLFLSLRYGHILLPSATNPALEYGGLIGESKKQHTMALPEDHSSSLPFLFLPDEGETEEKWGKINSFLKENNLSFPIILKPDIGQRGSGVKKVNSEEDVRAYLEDAPFHIFAQAFADYRNELGVFFIKDPQTGDISFPSVTEKVFPRIKGDGKTTLGNLILKDKRCRYTPFVYLKRFDKELNRVLKAEERVNLVESGNHAQGAIFKNGQKKLTPALESMLKDLLQKTEGIYIGRFDLRYKNAASLETGENIKIIELNGAGAEMTHIWDRKTKLIKAYQTLAFQWKSLFKIGSFLRKDKKSRPISVFKFIKLTLFYKFKKIHHPNV